MNDELDAVEQSDAGEIEASSPPAVEDIVASRAVATDRVFKGGSLAVLGFGGALLIDILNPSPGVPFWISIATALTVFGAGAIWAGSGATHLVRHGRKGSSLWLGSLAGLGGSVVLSVVTGTLFAALGYPALFALNRLAAGACGLFTAALILLGLIAIVRWMLPGPEPTEGDVVSDPPRIG
jgi:hypothetical protein